MATPFDPLAQIITPQQLQLQRAAEWNDAYLNDRKLAQNGQQAGFASLGTAIGQGLQAANQDSDPLAKRAVQNAAILNDANNSAANITDPFERQIAVLNTASAKFRAIGAFDTSASLDASLLQLKQQQAEMSQLQAKARESNAIGLKNEQEAPTIVPLAQDKLATDAETRRNLVSEQQKRAFDMNLPLAKAWFDPANPTANPVAIDDKDAASVHQAILKGLVPLGGGISVQGNKLGDLGSQPADKGTRDDINFGINSLTQLKSMRDLSESATVQGMIGKDGKPNLSAGIGYLGGKLGFDEAANLYQQNYNSMRANIQSAIKGTPSNRDAQIFEATIPEFLDPYNVKQAKFDVLENTYKSLIRLNIQEHAATKQALPDEVVQQAKALGVDVGNLPTMTIPEILAARQKLAAATQQHLSGAWGKAVDASKQSAAQSDDEFLNSVIARSKKGGTT